MPRFEQHSVAVRLALANYCGLMADLTEDGRWRSAAGMLIGKRAGRRPVNDDAALRYARALMAAGVARSTHRACLMAAQMYAPLHQVETVRDRLRKKLRRGLNVSEDAQEKSA